jgi:hypothetical protein
LTKVLTDSMAAADGIDFVDQRHAGLLVRHRHTAAANAQGADTGHRRRQVIGAHGLVVVQAQLLVQVVVKAHAEGAGAPAREMQHGIPAGVVGIAAP